MDNPSAQDIAERIEICGGKSMSYDFYVVKGKKLIDYKPTKAHYERAFLKYTEKIINGKLSTEDENKILFLMIKTLGIMGDERRETEEKVYFMFQTIEYVNNIISKKTPREIMQMFPIEKSYYDEKYGWKDYFYVIGYINKIGIDRPIGENVAEFIMEYQNIDINLFAVAMMSTVSDMSIMQNGTDPLLEFFKKESIHLQTFHQDGDYMVDNDTGERFKIQKPKNTMRKLFSVME